MTKDEASSIIDMLRSPDREIRIIAYELYTDWMINDLGKGVATNINDLTLMLAIADLRIFVIQNETNDSR